MPKKRVFTNNKKDMFLGPKRQQLSFEDVEKKENGNGFLKRLNDILPGFMTRWTGKMKPIHLTLITICLGIIGFLIWFLFFVLPSPIKGINPENESYTNNNPLKVSATFSRDIKPSDVGLKVDGKPVLQPHYKSKSVYTNIELPDGKHNAEVSLKGGGLMGNRTEKWNFVVDTSLPDLDIKSSKIVEEKDSDAIRVNLTGKTEPGATVKVGGNEVQVDSKGSFKSLSTATRSESLEIVSTDKAGNASKDYIVTQKDPEAKGIHASVYIASSDSALDKMIKLIERTELNAIQVDLKDEYGQLAFTMDNPIAQKAGSNTKYVKLDACIDRLRYKDIYTIARVVVFKDPMVTKNCYEYAVRDSGGGPWGDGKWVDPYSRDIWDYNIAVAIAAAKAGFNEIQFDYTRFPSDGSTDRCVFPYKDDRKKAQVIDDFLAYAREQLGPYNVFISVDMFGLTASGQGEMGIGQDVKAVGKRVDYISPMVYPSHYNPGEYNIKDPESNPGDTVAASMVDFKNKLKDTNAKLRPWLQDFSLRITYTSGMVRRQIDAVENAGVNEWLLWDPDCTYSEDALKKE